MAQSDKKRLEGKLQSALHAKSCSWRCATSPRSRKRWTNRESTSELRRNSACLARSPTWRSPRSRKASPTQRTRKALFIERGLAATFVEDLEALIAAIGTASNTRETGRGEQVGGTAGLESIADEGLKTVRQLRACMRVKLRDDAALLAEWTTAARVHSVASSSSAPPPPDSSGGSAPAGS